MIFLDVGVVLHCAHAEHVTQGSPQEVGFQPQGQLQFAERRKEDSELYCAVRGRTGTFMGINLRVIGTGW